MEKVPKKTNGWKIPKFSDTSREPIGTYRFKKLGEAPKGLKPKENPCQDQSKLNFEV